MAATSCEEDNAVFHDKTIRSHDIFSFALFVSVHLTNTDVQQVETGEEFVRQHRICRRHQCPAHTDS